MIIHPNVRPLRLILRFTTNKRGRRPHLPINLPRNTRRYRTILFQRVRVGGRRVMSFRTRGHRHLFPIVAMIRTMNRPPRTTSSNLTRNTFVFGCWGIRRDPPFCFFIFYITFVVTGASGIYIGFSFLARALALPHCSKNEGSREIVGGRLQRGNDNTSHTTSNQDHRTILQYLTKQNNSDTRRDGRVVSKIYKR